MKRNLLEYSIIHEKTFIYKNGRLEFHYVCEHPEINEFVTFSGFYNIEEERELEDRTTLAYKNFNRFQTKLEALEESQDWLFSYIEPIYDPFLSMVELLKQIKQKKN